MTAKHLKSIRKDRFGKLLTHFQITEYFNLDDLTEQYKSTLENSLELKTGAKKLILKLKSLNKTIIVITEGPEDAQEWTIEKLSLKPHIDILVATNKYGKSKVDGLFQEVLQFHQIPKESFIYIGDSIDRDIIPTEGCSITNILLDEQNTNKNNSLHCFIIRSLEELNDFLDKSYGRMKIYQYRLLSKY